MSAQSPIASKKTVPGEVVTFYSYKGGTGRTMSMVNLACLLADRIKFGERILLVDWDLEAPGLHRYFHGRLRPAVQRENSRSTRSDATDHPGLIDLFACLREAGDSAALKRKRKQDVRARALLDVVDLDQYILSTHLPNLDMIKAGRFDGGYGARVNTFPWEGFYNQYPLAFREFAERLKQRYRYVFIDSRTGQTDTAGICTTLMPEKLVLVFTPNRQSLYGIENVLKDAVAYRRRDQDSRPLVAYPLPSRVEVAQDDLRARWRFGDSTRGLEGYEPFLNQAMKAAYGIPLCHLKRFFDEIQIKHSPVYAFGEEIAVLNERTQKVEDDYSLTRAYQNLLAWLEPGYLPWESPEAIRLMRSLEKRAGGPELETTAFGEDLAALRELATRFANEGDRGNAELAIRTGETFARKYLGDSHSESLAYGGALARLYLDQGKTESARRMAENLVRLSMGTLGDDHVDTQEYKSILAKVLLAQGDHEKAHALQSATLAVRRRVLGEEHPDTLTSMNDLAETLQAQGDLVGALERQKSVLATRRRVLGEEHPDTLGSMGNLASTLWAQGDLADALELQKSALATLRRVLGEEHPDTLTLMNNLANTLHAQGDLAGAREFQNSALATRRRVLGEEHPDTLASMNNLASTLKAQGDLAGALELEKSALATRRRVQGEEHPETLTSMNNLASTLKAQGDLACALELQKSALATQRRVLGEEHPDTLGSMNNLASILHAQGDLAGALELHQSVLATQRRVLGVEHPDTLGSMNNLALNLHDQGDLAGALELQKSALATLRQVQGEEHPDTLTAMSNLASILNAQRNSAGALELEKSVLATRRWVQGEEHPDTLTSMNNLASTLKAQGDLAGALELERSALATRRRVLGEEHPDTLTSMDNLAGTLRALGDLAGALELEKSVLATRRQVLGQEHPGTLTSMNNLALTLKAQGDLAGALELEKSALAARRRVLGAEHPDTLRSMNSLAITLHAQGDLAGALELEKSALATRRRALGEEHPDTLSSMNNLASTLHALGDLAGALELEKSALLTQRRVLGEEHPDTLSSMNNLALTLDALERGEEAARLKSQAKEIRQRVTAKERNRQDGAAVRIIGVGGAGCSAIETLAKESRTDVQLIAVNTDKLALKTSSASIRLLIGDGAGAGGDPEIGRQAALKHHREIRELIDGAQLLFIVAGLGGGTGTGASPVLAEIARELGVLTVAIATTPFSFEDKRRQHSAAREMELLRTADALVTISNDDVAAAVGEDATMTDVFRAVYDEVENVIRSIVDVACVPGLVNIDFEDLRTLLLRKGRISVANARADGSHRATRAAELAIAAIGRQSGGRLTSASGILINITANHSLGLREYKQVLTSVRPLASPNATILCGAVFDDSMADSLRVTIVAAGFGEPDGKLGQSGSASSSGGTNAFAEGQRRIVIKQRK